MRRVTKILAPLATFAVAVLSSAAAFASDAPAPDLTKGYIARNPQASGKILVPMILGLALIESLVIYGLIIAFILVGKI
jgi:F-type H+-transporting ATPase subunit c